MNPKRYFLEMDDNAHLVLVPVEKRSEWQAWFEQPSVDAPMPDGCTLVGTTLSSITFENPSNSDMPQRHYAGCPANDGKPVCTCGMTRFHRWLTTFTET